MYFLLLIITTIERKNSIRNFIKNIWKHKKEIILTIVKNIHLFFFKVAITEEKIKAVFLDLIAKTSLVLRMRYFSVATDVYC
jgi:hypothetical protein